MDRSKLKSYVINLTSNTVRLKQFYNEYNENIKNLLGPVERFDAIDGYTVSIPEYWKSDTYKMDFPDVSIQGAYGCYMSHYTILQDFVNSNLEVIHIYEDDASFIDNFEEKYKLFMNNVPLDWDALYLGYTTNSDPFCINKYCYKVGYNGVNTTISYIINKNGAIKYLDKLDKIKLNDNFTSHEPIDCQYSRFMHDMNVYIPIEPLVSPGKYGAKEYSSVYV